MLEHLFVEDVIEESCQTSSVICTLHQAGLTLNTLLFRGLGGYQGVKIPPDPGEKRRFSSTQVIRTTERYYWSKALSISGIPVVGEEAALTSLSKAIYLNSSAIQMGPSARPNSHQKPELLPPSCSTGDLLDPVFGSVCSHLVPESSVWRQRGSGECG